MKPATLLETAIIPALSILPDELDTSEADAMLLAIALQESDIRHRVQKRGPARGFWQFEQIGVRGVQQHHASADLCRGVEAQLSVKSDSGYTAIEFQDVLAAAYARLLLWRYPGPLPSANDADEGWRQYVELWRPGRPRPDAWADNYAAAWDAVCLAL